MTTLQMEQMVENEPAYRQMVRYYITKAAVAVASENALTTNHAKRLTLAGLILGDADKYARRFMEAVVTNATIQSRNDIDDVLAHPGDIEFMVNSIYDAITQSV